MIKTARLRVRSATFKNGCQLRVLRSDDRGPRLDRFIENSKNIAEQRADMCGYAIVAWSRSGETSTAYGTIGAPIPLMMVPDFVKACLLDAVLEDANGR